MGEWVSEWLIVSDLEIAIASPSFASLFIGNLVGNLFLDTPPSYNLLIVDCHLGVTSFLPTHQGTTALWLRKFVFLLSICVFLLQFLWPSTWDVMIMIGTGDSPGSQGWSMIVMIISWKPLGLSTYYNLWRGVGGVSVNADNSWRGGRGDPSIWLT